MYFRIPGNVLLPLICLALPTLYLFRNSILPYSINVPQYLILPPSNSTETPTIIDPFLFQQQACTPTTVSLTKTAICPSSTVPSHQIHLEEQSSEQKVTARLRAAGITIIFKTGAQELSQLAIQLSTTLRHLHPRDILFFSDFQSSLGPFVIHDALRSVDQVLKETSPDFTIYRQIASYQATGRNIDDLREERVKGDDRMGWKLDKYKFLHMVEETFEKRPDAKWYVFIETDSYVFWDNLAAFLEQLDSKKPLYLGSAVFIGDTVFAHGGSGYVLSNAAMNRLLGGEMSSGLAKSWDSRMDTVCCGDLALGIALKEKGVGVTMAHPMLNGFRPRTYPYGPGEHWCQPVVTMHHMSPSEVSAAWRFERRREVLLENRNVRNRREYLLDHR